MPCTRLNRAVDKRQIFILPIHAHRHYPNLFTFGILRVGFIYAYRYGCTVGSQHLSLAESVYLSEAGAVNKIRSSGAEHFTHGAARKPHKFFVGISEIMQKVLTDRKDRKRSVIAADNRTDYVVMLDGIPDSGFDRVPYQLGSVRM